MSLFVNRHALCCALLIAVPVLICSGGCAILYQLAYGDGPKIEARYKGLSGRRVAVVCLMNPTTYGEGTTSTMVAEQVAQILRDNVEEIDVVRQDDVTDWLDTNNWEDTDYVEVGRGVKADMVVAIDIDAFSLHKSQTLLQGHAEVTTTVYDITRDGKEVFRTTDPDFTFPTTHAVPTMTAKTESFRRTFILLLAENIANNFYDYDMQSTFARDGAAYAH
jgi:hypothetical protein